MRLWTANNLEEGFFLLQMFTDQRQKVVTVRWHSQFVMTATPVFIPSVLLLQALQHTAYLEGHKKSETPWKNTLRGCGFCCIPAPMSYRRPQMHWQASGGPPSSASTAASEQPLSQHNYELPLDHSDLPAASSGRQKKGTQSDRDVWSWWTPFSSSCVSLPQPSAGPAERSDESSAEN